MDSKPIATYEGNKTLFKSLETLLIEGLPQEPVEWKRSYGRGPKTVHVEAGFVEFDNTKLPKAEGELHLLDQPYLHIYWTDCTDVEAYRTHVRDDIIAWMAQLKAAHVYDWMVVAVEHADTRRGNKTKLLPRTTVFDRMKADFPSKTIERCVSLLDPLRSDARAADSWQAFLVRLRQALLHACSRHMTCHEERVRARRECRTQPDWSFIDFFFLQEELAFMLEMLGLYDETLVQYDELDALFTQFVINSASGDMPEWLCKFTNAGCNEWPGLCLKKGEEWERVRKRLAQGASLLELRNYLFSRQCTMLLLLCRPWEMAERTVSFLHNTVQELGILEVSMTPGSVACWVFLSCLEVLSTCERFNDSTQVESYSRYTAALWSYAREKLKELGELCCLMPHQAAGSAQLHMVVGLLSGMGQDPYPDSKALTPHARLREALSSKESFLKHYLDLSEHTMITFKHIGRMRFAKLVGKDLAELYIQMGQHRKAVPFLLDLLRTYTDESWTTLALLMQEQVAGCYLATEDWPRFVRTSVQLSAQTALAQQQRVQHFRAAQERMQALKDAGDIPISMDAEDILMVTDAWLVSPKVSQCWVAGSKVEVILMVTSRLPIPVRCRRAIISVSRDDAGSKTTASQCPPESPIAVWGMPKTGRRVPPVPQMTVMENVQKNDGSTAVAILCKNFGAVLARPDGSHFSRFPGEPAGAPLAEVSPLDFVATGVDIAPGVNKICISHQVTQPGGYSLFQACFQWEELHFIQCCLPPQLTFTVVMESPRLQLDWSQGELLAGVKQKVDLVVTTGSCTIAAGETVHVKTSRGLLVKAGGSFAEEADVVLPALEPFTSTSFELVMMASLGPQRDSRALVHHVAMSLSRGTDTIAQNVQLHFLPPFTSNHRLHTCNNRKYVQVVLQGLTAQHFTVGNASLVAHDSDHVFLKPLNSSSQLLRVNTEQTAYFLWEMLDPDGEPIRFTFSVLYSFGSGENLVEKTYSYDFRVENYKTLYAVKVRVEPSKGSEFCRADSVCNMHINITQLNPTDKTSLMYEVVPDPATWAVCGRTAGVVNLDQEEEHTVTLEVKPLIRGFLPLPTVRLSKYIPSQSPGSRSSSDGLGPTTAKLEPFLQGQVYNWSRAMQVHVLASAVAQPAAAPLLLETAW